MDIVIIRDEITGLKFEIPFEFIANQKNSTHSHQICKFYLQGNGECIYSSTCKKLHINHDYFQNNIAQKIIQYMKQKNNEENNNDHDNLCEENIMIIQKKKIQMKFWKK